uniref:Uncharacterized protein n=1 Tax=Zonotrichia albicollis TaxID=44394 RepID=A0A8D2NHZ7_ZONAL
MQPTLSAVSACSPQCTFRSSSSTCAATCPARATTSCSAPGSMAGMEEPPAPAGGSPRGAPLSRIRRSRLLATNWVRRPSRSTVPSSSRALASVARRPSDSCRPATAAPPPPARLSASRLRSSRPRPSGGAAAGPGSSMASDACPPAATAHRGRADACLRLPRLAEGPTEAWPRLLVRIPIGRRSTARLPRTASP